MKSLMVREARKEDMPAFIRLWRQINGDNLTGRAGLYAYAADAEVLAGIFVRHICAKSEFLALAEADGMLVGYCLGGVYDGNVFDPGHTGEIRQLAVLPEYAELGVSGELCSFGREWFAEREVQDICLNPSSDRSSYCLTAGCGVPSGEMAGCGTGTAEGGNLYAVCWQTFS